MSSDFLGITREVHEAAALGVAEAAVQSFQQNPPREVHVPPDLDDAHRYPTHIVRSIILCQALLKRRGFIKEFGHNSAFAELAPPRPSVALALYMCRRARNPKWVDLDSEATAVSQILCGKEKGLSLGLLYRSIQSYDRALSKNHPAITHLNEKLHSVMIDSKEEIRQELAKCTTPSAVKACIDKCRLKMEVPDDLSQEVFGAAEEQLEQLAQHRESELLKEVKKCVTLQQLAALKEVIKVDFEGTETCLHEEIEEAERKRLKFLEYELDTRWAWPFEGPLPPHSRAARSYREELGASNAKVARFIGEEARMRLEYEEAAKQELSGLKDDVTTIAAKADQPGARAKPMMQAIQQELDAKMSEFRDRLTHWLEYLGADSRVVEKHARDVLSPQGFSALYFAEAEKAADMLRELAPKPETPDKSAQMQDALTTLGRLVKILGEHAGAKKLQQEFADDLRRVEAAAQEKDEPKRAEKIAETKTPVAAQVEDDEWSSPTGFDPLIIAEKTKKGLVGVPGADGKDAVGKGIETYAETQNLMDRLSDPLNSSVEVPGVSMIAKHDPHQKDMQSSKPGAAPLTAQLVLKDWSLEDIKNQDKEVLGKKFARAVAHATGVPADNVRVVCFEEGSIKVRLEFINPNAVDMIADLQEQCRDPASRLRCGELAPWVANADVEAYDNATEQPSMMLESFKSALSAPTGSLPTVTPFTEDPVKPGAAGGRGGGGGGGGGGGVSSKQGSKTSSGIAKPLIPSAWGPSEDHVIPGDIPGVPSLGPTPGEYQKAGDKNVFQTTQWGKQPRPDWAQPYADPPRYAFYGTSQLGPLKEKKWEPDAKFFLTRHPVGCSPPAAGGGSPMTKGAVHYKTWGALTLTTATSWLENEQGLIKTLKKTEEVAEKAVAGELPLEEEEPALSSEHPSSASEEEDEALPAEQRRKSEKKSDDDGAGVDEDVVKPQDANPQDMDAAEEQGDKTPSEKSTAATPVSRKSTKPKRKTTKKSKTKEADADREDDTPRNDVDGAAAEAATADDFLIGSAEAEAEDPSLVSPVTSPSAKGSKSRKTKKTKKEEKSLGSSDSIDTAAAEEAETTPTNQKKLDKSKGKKSTSTKVAKLPGIDEDTPSKDPLKDTISSAASQAEREVEVSPVVKARPGRSDTKGSSDRRAHSGSPDAKKAQKAQMNKSASAASVRQKDRISLVAFDDDDDVYEFERPRSEGAIRRKGAPRRLPSILDCTTLAAQNNYPTRITGMMGGLHGTGLRSQLDGGSKSKSLSDLTAPAFVRATFRSKVVGVGPPYNQGEPSDGVRPAKPSWSCTPVADNELDRMDWTRAYSTRVTEAGAAARLGPEKGIRWLGRPPLPTASLELPSPTGPAGKKLAPIAKKKPATKKARGHIPGHVGIGARQRGDFVPEGETSEDPTDLEDSGSATADDGGAGAGASAPASPSKLKGKPKAKAASDTEASEAVRSSALKGKSAVNKVAQLPGGAKGKPKRSDPKKAPVEADESPSDQKNKAKPNWENKKSKTKEVKEEGSSGLEKGGVELAKATGKGKARKGQFTGELGKYPNKPKAKSKTKSKGDGAQEEEAAVEESEAEKEATSELIKCSILMAYEQYVNAEQAELAQSYACGVTYRIAAVEHQCIVQEEDRVRQANEAAWLMDEQESRSYARRLTASKGVEATAEESASLASSCVGFVFNRISDEELESSRVAASELVPALVCDVAEKMNRSEAEEAAKAFIPALDFACLKRDSQLALEAQHKKELEEREAAKKKSQALLRGATGDFAKVAVGAAAARFLRLRHQGSKDITKILSKAAKEFAEKYTPRTAARELQKLAEKQLGPEASQADVWELMGGVMNAAGMPNPQSDIHEFLAMAAQELAEKYTPRTAARELEALAAKYLPAGSSPETIKELTATAKSVGGLPLDEEDVKVLLAVAARGLAEKYTPRTAAKELELVAATMAPPGTDSEKLKELAAGARADAGVPPTNDDLKVILAAAAKELNEKYTPRTAALELEKLAKQYLPPESSENAAKELIAAARHEAGLPLSEEDSKLLLTVAARELAEKYSPRTAARELEKIAVDYLPEGTTAEEARSLAAAALSASGTPLSDENIKQLMEVAAKELAEKYTPRTAAVELQKLAAQYLPPGASDQAVKELAAAAKHSAGLPLSEEDTQLLLTAAAREITAKHTPRTAQKELEALASKYLPDGASEEMIQALASTAMSAAAEPLSEEDAQLLLAKMARELHEQYTPRTAAVELEKLAAKYLPPGTSEEKLKELSAAARYSAGVPLSVEDTQVLLAVAARELAGKHTPRSAARELELMAQKYLPPGASEQAIKELTAGARQQAGVPLSEEDSQALLAVAARELAEKYTPRTAAKELEKLASQYMPEGTSEEAIREKIAAAKHDAGQPLSDDEAKVLLAAKARELAEKHTPRTAARELEKMAAEYLPTGTSEENLKALTASARQEAGVPLSEEDTKVLLAVAARELAEKYTPRTAAKELEKLAAEYLPPGASEEAVREATIAAKHAAGQPLSEEETQVMLTSAARDLAEKYTPRTAARELTKLAASCLPPDASAEELRDFMIAQKEAMGQELTQEEKKMVLAAAAKEFAEKYTPRTAAKELEALAAKLMPPGTDEQMLQELASAAKFEAGLPLTEEESKALLAAAVRELAEKYTPRTAAGELEKLAAQVAAEGSSEEEIQRLMASAKVAAGQVLSEEETKALLASAARELGEKYTPRTAAKELEKLAAQYLPPGTDDQILREIAAVAKQEAGLPLTDEDKKLVLSSAARELADTYTPRTAALELEKLAAEYLPEGASEEQRREMLAAAKAATGQPLSEEESKVLLAAAARELAEKYTPRTVAKELEKLAAQYLPPGSDEQILKQMVAVARQEAGQPLSEEDKKLVLSATARELAEKYTPRTAAQELEKLVAQYTPEGASEETKRELMAAAKHAAGQPLSEEEAMVLLQVAARDLSEKYTPRTAARELEKLAAQCLPPGTSEQQLRELAAVARKDAGLPLSNEDSKLLLSVAARELSEKYSPRTAASELDKLVAQYASEGATEEEMRVLIASAKAAAGQPLTEEETQVLLAVAARELAAKYTPRTAAQEIEKMAAQYLPPGANEDAVREATAAAKLAAGQPLSEEEAKVLLSAKARDLAEKYTPRTAARELEKLAAEYLPPGSSKDAIHELTAQAKYAAGVPLSEDEVQVLLNVAARELAEKHSPRTVTRELEELAAKYMAGADEDDIIEFAERAVKNAKGGDTRAQVASFARGIAHKAFVGSNQMVTQAVVRRGASPSSRSPSPYPSGASSPAYPPIGSMPPPAGRGRSPVR